MAVGILLAIGGIIGFAYLPTEIIKELPTEEELNLHIDIKGE